MNLGSGITQTLMLGIAGLKHFGQVLIGHFTVLSVLAWIESEAGVDLALIETSLLFLCK